MKLMNQILAQEPHEPQAAQRVESRSAVDARNVNLGDPGAMANVCSPSQLHLFRSSCRRFSSPIQQPSNSGPTYTARILERFVVAVLCCPLGSILCIHAAKDTLVLFQAQEDRHNDNARTDADGAVLPAVVVQANDEWKAIGVTDMRVSRFVDALHTAFMDKCVDKCPVHFVAGASDFSCRGS
jgi:hypothetical protein